MHTKSKSPTFSVVLYVLSAVMFVLAVAMTVTAVNTLSSYLEGYKSSLGADMGQTVTYVITQSLAYYVYAILMFAAGKIYARVSPQEALPTRSNRPDRRQSERTAKKEAKKEAKAEKIETPESGKHGKHSAPQDRIVLNAEDSVKPKR